MGSFCFDLEAHGWMAKLSTSRQLPFYALLNGCDGIAYIRPEGALLDD